jgi:hypothetical protein
MANLWFGPSTAYGVRAHLCVVTAPALDALGCGSDKGAWSADTQELRRYENGAAT